MNNIILLNNAYEMVLTNRYKDAGKLVLQIINNEPDNIEALILLGKIEYYLKKHKQSRKRFETVLAYSPNNMDAYMGLQFYKEDHNKKILFLSLFLTVFILIISQFVFFTISSDFIGNKLDDTNTALFNFINDNQITDEKLANENKIIIKKIEKADRLNNLKIDEIKKILNKQQNNLNILKKKQNTHYKVLEKIIELQKEQNDNHEDRINKK